MELIQTIALCCTAIFTFFSALGVWYRASIAKKDYELNLRRANIEERRFLLEKRLI